MNRPPTQIRSNDQQPLRVFSQAWQPFEPNNTANQDPNNQIQMNKEL